MHEGVTAGVIVTELLSRLDKNNTRIQMEVETVYDISYQGLIFKKVPYQGLTFKTDTLPGTDF